MSDFHMDLHVHPCPTTHTPTSPDTLIHTHTQKPGFCAAPHANEAKRSEMNPLSQRGAGGMLQAESSVRAGAWQSNVPSVDSFH